MGPWHADRHLEQDKLANNIAHPTMPERNIRYLSPRRLVLNSTKIYWKIYFSQPISLLKDVLKNIFCADINRKFWLFISQSIRQEMHFLRVSQTSSERKQCELSILFVLRFFLQILLFVNWRVQCGSLYFVCVCVCVVGRGILILLHSLST